ncbi:MAG: hypothetical protein ABI692_08580 [Terracoccus sp.]
MRFYEETPTDEVEVETPWSETWLKSDDWAAAFDAPAPGIPHNKARDDIWDELVSILINKHHSDVPAEQLRAWLLHDQELLTIVNRAWPLLETTDLSSPICGRCRRT